MRWRISGGRVVRISPPTCRFVLPLTEQHVRRMLWPDARVLVCGAGCELVARRIAPVFALQVRVDDGLEPLGWRLV